MIPRLDILSISVMGKSLLAVVIASAAEKSFKITNQNDLLIYYCCFKYSQIEIASIDEKSIEAMTEKRDEMPAKTISEHLLDLFLYQQLF